MVIIKKIKPFSLAKITGVFYALVGFGMALFSFTVFIISEYFNENLSGGAWQFILKNILLMMVSGLVAFVVLGIIGFSIGFLTAFFYNKLSKRLGGLVVAIGLEEEERQRQIRERWSKDKTRIESEETKEEDILAGGIEKEIVSEEEAVMDEEESIQDEPEKNIDDVEIEIKKIEKPKPKKRGRKPKIK